MDGWRVPVVAFLFPPLDSPLESTKSIFSVATETSYYLRLEKNRLILLCMPLTQEQTQFPFNSFFVVGGGDGIWGGLFGLLRDHKIR